MATHYAVRITRSYEQCAAYVAKISLLCEKMLVYEHVGTATEKVHVHMMLIGVRCDKKTIKDNASKGTALATLKGNGDWSWKTEDKKYGKVTDSVEYITYMTKGKFDPKYNKGYSKEELDHAKSLWVDHSGKSKDELLYAAFELMLVGKINNPHKSSELVGTRIVDTYPGFDIVRRAAISFAIEKVRVMNIKCKNMAQMLYNTYCWRHNIDKPPQFDKW